MEYKDFFIESSDSDKYKKQLDVWYRTYNIHREKIELFYNFLSSLYDLIDDTFLGVDVLYDENDQLNHFTWCWDKTINNFSKEKIYFKNTGTHYEYMWSFFFEAYYLSQMDEKDNRINGYLYRLFDFRNRKTRSELTILTEVYKLLDVNLKK
jgi:hypothetical protein